MLCKRKFVLLCALLFCAASARAQLQKNCPVHDVVPTENITSLEINPALDVVDDSAGVSVSKMTLKAFFALSRRFNIGAELPLARFEGRGESKNGLGDATLTFSAVTENYGRWSFGAQLETVWPTATADALGSGKVQTNPAVYAVYMPGPNYFVTLGYKQSYSAAGDGGRADISTGRIRSVWAYLSDDQWWVLADPRYVMDYKRSGTARLDVEAEVGTMVNLGTAVYLRGGGKVAGNMPGNDWTLSAGFKILYL